MLSLLHFLIYIQSPQANYVHCDPSILINNGHHWLYTCWAVPLNERMTRRGIMTKRGMRMRMGVVVDSIARMNV